MARAEHTPCERHHTLYRRCERRASAWTLLAIVCATLFGMTVMQLVHPLGAVRAVPGGIATVIAALLAGLAGLFWGTQRSRLALCAGHRHLHLSQQAAAQSLLMLSPEQLTYLDGGHHTGCIGEVDE